MSIIKKKINFLAIIGMTVAFGTFAFTAPKDNAINDDPLWYHTGITSDTEEDQEMYELANGSENCLSLNTVICTVQAPEDSLNPGFPDLQNAQLISTKQ